MHRALRTIALVMLSSAALAQSPTFTAEQRAEGERQIAQAGKMLADTLRNPTTARFRNVMLFKTVGKDGLEHVSFCGEVNSQNGFGGMSGFQNFTLAGTMLITSQTQFISADAICGNATPRVHDTRDYSPELRKAFDANAGQ